MLPVLFVDILRKGFIDNQHHEGQPSPLLRLWEAVPWDTWDSLRKNNLLSPQSGHKIGPACLFHSLCAGMVLSLSAIIFSSL